MPQAKSRVQMKLRRSGQGRANRLNRTARRARLDAPERRPVQRYHERPSAPFPLFCFSEFAPITGSFIGLLIHRLPVGRDVGLDRSECDVCGHKLTAFDLLPVLNWVLSRGRCRFCGAGVSFLYPLIELAALGPVVWAWSEFAGWPAVGELHIGLGPDGLRTDQRQPFHRARPVEPADRAVGTADRLVFSAGRICRSSGGPGGWRRHGNRRRHARPAAWKVAWDLAVTPTSCSPRRAPGSPGRDCRALSWLRS